MTIGVTVWETVPGASEQDAKADTPAALTDIDDAFRFRVEGPMKFRLFADYDGYLRWPQRMTVGDTYEVKPGDKTANRDPADTRAQHFRAHHRAIVFSSPA